MEALVSMDPILRTLLSKSRLPSLAHDFLPFLPLATTRVFTLDFKDISLINDPASCFLCIFKLEPAATCSTEDEALEKDARMIVLQPVRSSPITDLCLHTIGICQR